MVTKTTHQLSLPSGCKESISHRCQVDIKKVLAIVAKGTKECGTELLEAGQAQKTRGVDTPSSPCSTEVQEGMSHMTLVCKDGAVACQEGVIG